MTVARKPSKKSGPWGQHESISYGVTSYMNKEQLNHLGGVFEKTMNQE